MILRLLKECWLLDVVLFYDGGMEFDAVYKVIDLLEKLCLSKGIQFIRVKPDKPFEYKAFEMPINTRSGEVKTGYSWCGGMCRWATADKLNAISKFYKGYEEDMFIIEYVGIAADEKERAERQRKICNDGRIKLFPLIEWGMTEAQCLQYCYAEGISWKEDGYELYDYFDRVSCFCCRNKNIKELRNMFKFFPKYWNRLKEMQSRTSIPFYSVGGYTIMDLEKRFMVEGIGWDLFDYANSEDIKL